MKLDQHPVPRLWYRMLEPFVRGYERRGILGKTIAWSLIVLLVGLLLDRLAHSMTLPWHWERLCENVVEAIIIGIFVYAFLDAREKRLRRRFKELGYLNHHIRNALTIIEMAESNITDAEKHIEMVKDASSRIRCCVEKISRQEDTEINEKEPQKP
jgi:hypothetical protein